MREKRERDTERKREGVTRQERERGGKKVGNTERKTEKESE